MDFSTRLPPRDERPGSTEGVQRLGPVRLPASPHMAKAIAPNEAPKLDRKLIEKVLEALSEHEVEAPFKSFLDQCVALTWLPSEEGDLGRTSFDLTHAEMVRRRRHCLEPGIVRIELHPVLLEDSILYRRTLAHELFHAAGVTEHGEMHDRLSDSVQRSPRLSESELLRVLKEEAHMNYDAPKAQRRCPSCAVIQTVARPRCQICNERMA